LRDINRRGDAVGTLRPSNLMPQLNAAFLFANDRLTDLSTAIGSGPIAVRDAVAITDDRAIAATVATASIPGVDTEFRAVLLVPIVPAAPTNLAASVTGAVVSLSWTAVTGALGYVIEAGRTSGARDLYNAVVGTQPSFTTPAPPGRYYVRVRARTAAVTSEPSNEIIVQVPAEPRPASSAPGV
jgi:hypothetical protein